MSGPPSFTEQLDFLIETGEILNMSNPHKLEVLFHIERLERTIKPFVPNPEKELLEFLKNKKAK